jgi:prepilin signal peptidase PulO-like enzyme (type II secretory pathway)
MIDLLLIILGLSLALLINILADDLPHRLIPSRPHCHSCSFPQPRWQWLATVALLTGRGRCGQCGSPITWRKPVVELASVLILLFLYHRFDLTLKFGLLALLLECLLLITVIDMEHRLILYVTIFPAAAAALLYGLFGAGADLQAALTQTLTGGAVGFGVFYLFFLLGQLYGRFVAWRRGEPLDEIAFGGGDANLGGVVGLAVGWPGIILTLFYTVLSGGAVAALVLVIMFLRRRNALLIPIPYGPFIVFGAVIVLVFADELRRLVGITP